jgi:regulator of sirC expression with transglutaminase-like and TPR domain
MTAPATVSADRLARLREDAVDAGRVVARLSRLLRRQVQRRARLTRTIAGTRRRLHVASEQHAECKRALAAAGGAS